MKEQMIIIFCHSEYYYFFHLILYQFFKNFKKIEYFVSLIIYYIIMPHKDKNDTVRKRGKDKQYERFIKNGQYSQKHIRFMEKLKEDRKIKKVQE